MADLEASAANGGAPLAITGRREFWPDNEPVWLVSPSCVPQPEIDPEGQTSVAGVIPYPWTHDNLGEVHTRLRRVYDRVLDYLAARLNTVHGTTHARRYWHVVIGPWLFQYLNLLAHHEASLETARARLGAVWVYGLAESEFVTPSTTLDFIYEATDDLYNAQLYTRLCELAEIEVRVRLRPQHSERLALSANPENRPRIHVPIVRRAAARVSSIAREAMDRVVAGRVEVLLRRSYLPQRFARHLSLRSAARVWTHEGPEYAASRAPMRADMRGPLSGFSANDTLLERYVSEFVACDVPRAFVEDRQSVVALARKEYARFAPRAVLSTVAWFTDHAFGHFAADAAERGARLIGGQHGGDSGIERQSQTLAFERSLTDAYLTWGWKDASDSRLIPTPAARLVEMKPRSESTGDAILYVGTVALRFPTIARPDFSNYFELQRRFFEVLSSPVRTRMDVRLHASDFGWGIARRLRSAVPGIQLSDPREPFSEALRRCRLYVCDHVSTTFAEALATDTPTVMFWDPVFFDVREAERPIFDAARCAGIVHNTPESAGRFVSDVYAGVERWWNAPATRAAASRIRESHARTSPDPEREWLDVLRNVLGEPPSETQ